MNRPVALVCYICGREYGTKSLGIHIKACQKKWQNQQNLKPLKQRRPCPRPPQGLDQLLNKNTINKQDINSFNSNSFETFKDQALIKCEYCGRKFNPKSLAPHQKACKTNPMIRKPYISKDQRIEEQEEEPIRVPSKGYNFSEKDEGAKNIKLIPCGSCGRTFASDRVSKHQKVCKGPQHKTVPGITEKYSLQTQPKNNKKQVQKKMPKWKIQSLQLQNAMKANRQMKMVKQNGGNISSLPPPPRSNYDHYIDCKYCGRKYAPDVAERHIPKCANIINKPGGIKPSTIQQKYIQGTGGKTITKPTIQVASKIVSQPQTTKITSSGQLNKPGLSKLPVKKY